MWKYKINNKQSWVKCHQSIVLLIENVSIPPEENIETIFPSERRSRVLHALRQETLPITQLISSPLCLHRYVNSCLCVDLQLSDTPITNIKAILILLGMKIFHPKDKLKTIFSKILNLLRFIDKPLISKYIVSKLERKSLFIRVKWAPLKTKSEFLHSNLFIRNNLNKKAK